MVVARFRGGFHANITGKRRKGTQPTHKAGFTLQDCASDRTRWPEVTG